VEVAVQKFGGIDGLVNNAGIFIAKPFIDYSTEDLDALVYTNLKGYLYVSQLVIKQMLAQNAAAASCRSSSILTRTPNASLTCAVPMFTKGGIDAAARKLAVPADVAVDAESGNLGSPQRRRSCGITHLGDVTNLGCI
jgi:NAD(P)-dependent dehydrogenase (short-subunit alcohol dehydrogenase family)